MLIASSFPKIKVLSMLRYLLFGLITFFSRNWKEEEFNTKIAEELKNIVAQLNEKGTFDKIYIVKPFSVNYVNEDFGVIEELLFLDDEMLKLDDELLKGMDKELDDFLEKLLTDVE